MIPILLLTVFCLILTIFSFKEFNKRKLIIYTISLIIGMTVFAAPQSIINKENYNNSTPMVYTGENPTSLYINQLTWGIYMTRYETYVGDEENYPDVGVPFINETGVEIVNSYRIDGIVDYIKCFFQYPMEMLGIYFEHFISGITLFYNNVYIPDIHVQKWIFISNILIFLVAYLGILAWWDKFKVKKVCIAEIKNVVLFVLIFLPALISMPGAIETRFFLPIYVYTYIFITMFLDYKALYKYLKRDWLYAIISISILLLCWFMTASHILSGIQHGEMTISSFRLL